MNVVIVASHDIKLTRDIASKVASLIVVLHDENEREIATWGNSNMISIRAPIAGGSSSPVEKMAMTFAAEVGLDSYTARPYRKDRAANFERDYSLVAFAERVVAFFNEDRVMEGGTGHVVEAALSRGIPVEAWTHDASGTLVSIGSDEGFDVGLEGSRWMQQRYLEWESVETQLQSEWAFPGPIGGLAWTTASPAPIVIGTVMGLSINPNDGAISGKVLLNEPTSILTTPSSTPLFSLRSRRPSFIEPPSG